MATEYGSWVGNHRAILREPLSLRLTPMVDSDNSLVYVPLLHVSVTDLSKDVGACRLVATHLLSINRNVIKALDDQC